MRIVKIRRRQCKEEVDKEEEVAAGRAEEVRVQEGTVSVPPAEPVFLINGAVPVIKDLARNAVKK